MINPTLVIMIGIPGSGKSTVVDKLNYGWAHKNFTIISPDKIREEFCNGDRACQTKNKQVWAEAYTRVNELMRNNNDIIFDSTMVSRKSRKKLINLGKKAKYHIVAVVVQADMDVIKARNADRFWGVPDKVVNRMHTQFQYPNVDEGVDYIMDYHT